MFVHTTIAKDYVKQWGVKEGVREIIQNALDSEDRGNQMGVTYIRDRRQLVVFNRGVSLQRSSLLLGSTTKEGDDSQRGQYGEGFKLGSLALVREGKPVTIYNGDTQERWDCSMRKSPDFDCEVLAFEITKRPHLSDNKLVFEINGITPEEWGEMRDMFLHIYAPQAETIYKTPDGQVLVDKHLRGKVYCGGIYVCTDKDLQYGYNFPPQSLRLNRDRNMIDSFNLRWNTSKLWAYLSTSRGKLFDAMDMLKKGTPDVEYMKEFSDYTVKGKIAEEFFKEHATRSYPVTTEAEANEVRGLGYRPVFSSSYYSGMVREKLGTIEDLKRTVELDYQIFQNLTPIDDANVQWVFEVMWTIDPKFEFKMTIAKFNLDTTRSISDKDGIVVNCNLIQSKYDLLHEAIKHYCLTSKNEETQVWKALYKKTVDSIAG